MTAAGAAALVTTHELATPADLNAADGLDLGLYSRMKHGDLDATRALALPLARRLLEVAPELGTSEAPVLLPVAYMSVRPACWFLARAVADTIDQARADRGLPRARLIHVVKNAVTATDYATASAAQRAAELAAIRFQLVDDVRGAHLVVVDDVRVTGAAERTILAPLMAGGPQSAHVAYLATVTGVLAADPAVEAHLNHAAVNSVTDLIPALRRGDFALTIRFLKRLLAATPAERAAFLSVCSPQLLDELADGVATSGPALAVGFQVAIGDIDAARRVAA